MCDIHEAYINVLEKQVEEQQRTIDAMRSSLKNAHELLEKRANEKLKAQQGSFNLKQFQQEQKKWSNKNFPDNKPYHPLLGAVEELGELAHAHLKFEQGIRGMNDEKLDEKAKDAIADVIIYLTDYCNHMGYDLESLLEDTWNIVKKRDWQQNKETGQVEEDNTPSYLKQLHEAIHKKGWNPDEFTLSFSRQHHHPFYAIVSIFYKGTLVFSASAEETDQALAKLVDNINNYNGVSF